MWRSQEQSRLWRASARRSQAGRLLVAAGLLPPFVSLGRERKSPAGSRRVSGVAPSSADIHSKGRSKHCPVGAKPARVVREGAVLGGAAAARGVAEARGVAARAAAGAAHRATVGVPGTAVPAKAAGPDQWESRPADLDSAFGVASSWLRAPYAAPTRRYPFSLADFRLSTSRGGRTRH